MTSMAEAERCPNCDTLLHPADVSDLYRGHKLDCHHCGYRLQATKPVSASRVQTSSSPITGERQGQPEKEIKVSRQPNMAITRQVSGPVTFSNMSSNRVALAP